MSYFDDSYQGVGAIAAMAPAPKSAPAPSVGRMRAMTRGMPRSVVRRPRVSRPIAPPKKVYPGVQVVKQSTTRAGIVLEGKRKVVPWTGVLRQYGKLKRTPSGLMVAPVVTRPSIMTAPPPPDAGLRVGSASQIGTGIGTPSSHPVRVDTAPPRPGVVYGTAVAEPGATPRTAGAPRKGAEYDDWDMEAMESQLVPEFQPQPVPAEVVEAADRVARGRSLSTTSKVVLGGIAVVGIILLARSR